jgi:hypothetical protein
MRSGEPSAVNDDRSELLLLFDRMGPAQRRLLLESARILEQTCAACGPTLQGTVCHRCGPPGRRAVGAPERDAGAEAAASDCRGTAHSGGAP